MSKRRRGRTITLTAGEASLLDDLARELGSDDEGALRFALACLAVTMRDGGLMMQVSRALADRNAELSGDARNKPS